MNKKIPRNSYVLFGLSTAHTNSSKPTNINNWLKNVMCKKTAHQNQQTKNAHKLNMVYIFVLRMFFFYFGGCFKTQPKTFTTKYNNKI